MIRFFSRIRQKLIGSGNLRQYVVYALGEILLVMVGILLALQVNTWNQHRKDEIDFKFALKQLHKELTIDILMTDAMIDAGMCQNELIDELYHRPDSIPDSQLIRSLLALDFHIEYFREQVVNTDFRESLIDFNPRNSFQNELSSMLLKYVQMDINRFNSGQSRDEPGFHQYLEAFHIVDFPMRVGETFDTYINKKVAVDSNWLEYQELANNYRSNNDEANLILVRKLLADQDYRVVLLERKYDILSTITGLDFQADIASDLLFKINEYLPGLKIQHEQLQITGSAAIFEVWKSHLDMQPVDNDGLVWEVDVELPDSFIKFRTDKSWTFNWGAGYTRDDRLVFNGPNIEVDAGHYHIVVDLGESTYTITPIKSQ